MGGDAAWGTYTRLAAYWLVTPIFVAPPVYVITKVLRSPARRTDYTLGVLAFIVGVVIANMDFLVLGSDGSGNSIAGRVGDPIPGPELLGVGILTILIATGIAYVVFRAATRDAVRAQRRFLLTLGALMAFTAGGGKVGLAVGPLLPLFDDVLGGVSITLVLIFGGIGMILGTWMAAPRMIKALTQDYSMLGPRRAIAIFIPSFVIAQVGIFYGLPMAFNQIFIAAIAGTGYAVGAKTVSERKMLITAVAWIGSIIFGLLIGYALYTGVGVAFGWT